MRHPNHTHRRPRAGFTLVEILVVIAIMATLLALSTAAYQRVRITQSVRSSEATVTKIQMGLDNQVKIIADNVRREAQDKSPDFNGVLAFCGGGSSNEDLAAAVLLHCRLRQYLPQTRAEVQGTGFSLGTATFTRPKAFDQLATGLLASDPDEQVAAAALYVALTAQAQGGNTFAADEVLSGAQLDITLPGSGKAVRIFKDGWGNPIPFVRFFQSAELDAPPFTDGKGWKDPFDPRAKIYGWSGLNKTTFQNSVGLSSWGRNTTVTAYSAGVNKTPDAPLGAVDDIMGFKLRAIGAKGAKQ